ncbi:MAG: YjbE family putative metal transport protein [Methyloligellaceae bacterium]
MGGNNGGAELVISWDVLYVFLTVVGIDIILSGDNAIVIGAAASRLPPEDRRRAISYGIVGAAVLRIFFAFIAFQLLKIVGLLLAGGLLLLWVAWTMWREFQAQEHETSVAAETAAEITSLGRRMGWRDRPFRQALTTIIIADVSMSLDNVLAVTGAAHDHLYILIFGLALSVMLMAIAAHYIANLLARYNWLMYVGIALVAFVAFRMIYDGSLEVGHALALV